MIITLRSFLKNQISKNRELLLRESKRMNGFTQLLINHAVSEKALTKGERKRLNSQLIRLSFYVPILAIFLLPFGSFILPILAEVLYKQPKNK